MACNETCIVIFQTVIYNKIKTIGVGTCESTDKMKVYYSLAENHLK